ncbi:MAG: ABC transporter permease [Mesorhizobium sp.]
MPNAFDNVRPFALALLGVALLIVVPWTVAVSLGVRPIILPSGTMLWQSLVSMIENNSLAHAAWVSLWRVNIGFVAAVVTAVPLGIVLGRSRLLFKASEPVIESFRFVIPFAWIPLAVLWFGTSEFGKIFIIWYAGFFVLLLPTIEAVQSINKDLINAARTLGAGRWTIFWKVALPAIFPALVVAMRVAFAICWISILSAELVASRSGLGYMMMDARELLQTEVVIIAMATIGCIGALYNAIFAWLQRRATY